MAGTATHFIFGLDVYEELADAVGRDPEVREAFLLGNFGPDPFLFLKAIPAARRYHMVGLNMHRKRTPELLSALHERFVAAPDATAVTRSYALGFVCHFFLDSAVHPLVNGQQNAILTVGIEGLTKRRARRAIHATIETELDELMMTTKLGVTPADAPPHRTMFRCPIQVLSEVSERIAGVNGEVYGIAIPTSLFTKAYYFNKMCQAAFDSKCAGLRKRVDYIALLGKLSPYVRSSTYSGRPCFSTPFANDDHIPWPSPAGEGLVVDASFGELYASSFARVLEDLPRYSMPSFGLEECRALTGGINFAGVEVSSDPT